MSTETDNRPWAPGTHEPRAKLRPSGVPTRIDRDSMSPAELAICEVMQQVEMAGASAALTDAVVLLERARNRVADHVEGYGHTLDPSLASDDSA